MFFFVVVILTKTNGEKKINCPLRVTFHAFVVIRITTFN